MGKKWFSVWVDMWVLDGEERERTVLVFGLRENCKEEQERLVSRVPKTKHQSWYGGKGRDLGFL